VKSQKEKSEIGKEKNVLHLKRDKFLWKRRKRRQYPFSLGSDGNMVKDKI